MVLRGLLYQLTGDPDVAATGVKTVLAGYFDVAAPATEADVALLRRKGAAFLKAYRDSGAGDIAIGPRDRLAVSLGLMLGQTLEGENLRHHVEELALDPAVRSLHWREKPDPARLKDFTVTVIGAGMGGLNAALQLRQAGFPFTVLEKNTGVGGTWWENRYPGARVDTPSRSYTHLFGVDFPYPNPFCEWRENVKYFDWVADNFDLRRHIQFETEVKALTWDEAAGEWQIDIEGPDGARTIRSRAVITSVGFLSRPNIPNIAGAETFAGASWHTARWPQDVDLKGKRVAVIGTGCTGYQMVPEIALEAAHVTVFQRTAQWLFPVPGYRSPFPPQVNWLDRNLPFHTNFMRARTCSLDRIANVAEIDPDFKDPYAVQPAQQAGSRWERRIPGAQARRSGACGGHDATAPGLVGPSGRRRPGLLHPGRPAARQRHAGHRRDRAHRAARHRGHGRDAARGRRDRLRHRLPRHRVSLSHDHHRPRGADARGSVGEGWARAPTSAA